MLLIVTNFTTYGNKFGYNSIATNLQWVFGRHKITIYNTYVNNIACLW